jgi:hypothetical protein
VRALAQKALDIQDACNPIAVANFIVDAQKVMSGACFTPDDAPCGGHDAGIQSPVIVIIIDKLCDLARLERDFGDECWRACYNLAAGNDVQWEIRPLF